METIIAVLTPPGKAAIATLAVRGPLAWAIARELFQPHSGELPQDPFDRHYWFGRFGVDQRDEIVLTVKEAMEPSLAIHCHGGVEVVRMIEELHVERGVRAVSWQTFIGHDATLLDLLARAPTMRTAAILLDQVDGAFEKHTQRGDSIEELATRVSLGRHLVEPWKIAIAGAPNVGKSSLMNALAGFTRSIVAAMPGTTRDVVRLRVAIDGWPVELIDTAGIRETSEKLEGAGIERAYVAIDDADLRLWLLDGASAPVFPSEKGRWVFVINKIDLPAAWDWTSVDALHISAQTQAGVSKLCDVISRRLVPDPPASGACVPCTAAQIAWVLDQATQSPMVPRERET
jgi:tRNA modification GTPase